MFKKLFRDISKANTTAFKTNTPARLGFALTAILISLSFASEQAQATKPSFQASSQIEGPYFNHEDSESYTDPYRGIYRHGSDLESHILKAIESARVSIDLAIQELRLPYVAKALARKKRSGVRVRLILENLYNFSIAELNDGDRADERGYSGRRLQEYLRFVDMNGDGQLSAYEISQRDAISIVRNAGIETIDDTADGSRGSSLMHHKFLLIDGRKVLVTSANFTMSDTHGDYTSQVSRGNANALMLFNNPSVVRIFLREFDTLWGSTSDRLTRINKPRFGMQKPYRGAQRVLLPGSSEVTIQFSPTPRGHGFNASSSGLIDRTLQRAHSSVNLALFVFSEQKFADTLNSLRKRFPLAIKALVEPTFAYNWYSELLDMMGLKLFGPACLEDQGNQVWNPAIQTVGVPNLPDGDFLHHKFGVVDAQYVIFGSQNWSSAANVSNDENVMVIDDSQVAKRFEEEFARLYQGARLGPTANLKRKIEEQRRICNP